MTGALLFTVLAILLGAAGRFVYVYQGRRDAWMFVVPPVLAVLYAAKCLIDAITG